MLFLTAAFIVATVDVGVVANVVALVAAVVVVVHVESFDVFDVAILQLLELLVKGLTSHFDNVVSLAPLATMAKWAWTV